MNTVHSTLSEGIWKDKSSHYAMSDNNNCNVTGVQHVQANGKRTATDVIQNSSTIQVSEGTKQYIKYINPFICTVGCSHI